MKFLVSLLLLATASSSLDLQDHPWIWDEVEDFPPQRKSDTTTPPVSTFRTRETTRTGSTESTTVSTTTGTPKICPQCPFSQEYNPVCGTDRITYDNAGMLRCSKVCGVDVDILFYGRCKPLSISR